MFHSAKLFKGVSSINSGMRDKLLCKALFEAFPHTLRYFTQMAAHLKLGFRKI